MPAGPSEAVRQSNHGRVHGYLREAAVHQPISTRRAVARIALATVLVGWLTLPGRGP